MRVKLGLDSYEPLSAALLAEKQGAVIWKLSDIPGLGADALSYLTSSAGDEWSAITVVCDDLEVIVVNPSHSAGRTSSDVMHEVAHLILGHESAQMFLSEDGFMLREYNEKQEAEADWLAGTLLLPRKALEHIKYNHIPLDKVTEDYAVSEQLFSYRCSMTAINRQFSR